MRTFPSSQRRGGCAIKKMPRSRHSGQFGWPWKGAELTTPSATNRNGSVFWMSRTPLLCEEGTVRPENFVQKTKSCSLVTQRQNTKGTNFFVLFVFPFVPFVYCSRFPVQSPLLS